MLILPMEEAVRKTYIIFMSNVTFNTEKSRYEMNEDGRTVFARVRKQGNILFIDYVESPPELRGTGAAGRFMTALMEHVRTENLKVVPICGYAATWMQRQSEYNDLM